VSRQKRVPRAQRSKPAEHGRDQAISWLPICQFEEMELVAMREHLGASVTATGTAKPVDARGQRRTEKETGAGL